MELAWGRGCRMLASEPHPRSGWFIGPSGYHSDRLLRRYGHGLFTYIDDRLLMMMSFPGEEVDRQLCRDAIFPIPVACYAPCPRDCVLTMWSAWSSCSHTCSGKTTEGKQIRSRSILAYAGEEGKVTSFRRHLGSFQKLACVFFVLPG